MNWHCLVIGFAVGLLVGEFVLMLAMMFFAGTGGGDEDGDKQKLEELESKVAWLMDIQPFMDEPDDRP